MTAYVAEINGRAIAAFNAENDIQAEGRASSKPFRGDLTVLENEGQPLPCGAEVILHHEVLSSELISNEEERGYRSMRNLLFWLGIGAAQKGAGSKEVKPSRHRVISLVVGILLALLIGAGL